MLRPFRCVLGLVAGLALAIVSIPAAAAPIIIHLTTDTGDLAGIKLTIEEGTDAHVGDLNFSVEFEPIAPAPPNATIGDLTGLFFNVVGDATTLGLTVSDVNVLAGKEPVPLPGDFILVCTGNDNIGECGKSSNNLNGATSASFDVGIAIGKNGASVNKGDIQEVEFFLTAATGPISLGLIDLSQPDDFGARIQSVGTGTRREGSTKLLGFAPPVDIPEPATLGLLGVALLGLGWARRRRSA
jgi:hypothetical protein